MISLLLMRKITQLFIIMFFGYLITKFKIIKSQESIVLSKLLLYLVMPCIIINAYQVEFTSDIRQGILLSFMAAVLLHVIFISIGWSLQKFFHLEAVGVSSVIYPNSGNLTIPLTMALLGNEWVVYASVYVSLQLVFLWTHCRTLFADDSEFDIKKILLNVNMISVFIGLILMLTGLSFPPIIAESIGSVASMIGPLAMLITGMIVGGMDLKKIFTTKKIYIITLLRNFALPIITVLILRLMVANSSLSNAQPILLITLIAAIGPSASTIPQFAQVYNKDAEYAGSINIMTTLFCILTMPIFVWFYYI